MRPVVLTLGVSLMLACNRGEAAPPAQAVVPVTAAAASIAVAAVKPSNLDDDEVLVLLPTFATLREGAWQLPIDAWVFEPQNESLVRRAAFAAVGELAEFKVDDATADRLVQNIGPFFADNERDKRVVVAAGGVAQQACQTTASGRCRGVLPLPTASASGATRSLPGGVSVLDVHAVLRAGDPRSFEGMVFLLDDAGISVISDIDDTVKVTGCDDKKKLLENTLLRPPVAAVGMASLYQRWASQGAAFHYVSNSPLPLQAALLGFLRDDGFPAGTLALKPFRWTDGSFLDLLAPPEDHKQAVLEALVAPWSARKFVLVGDTGERDPEIYAALARKFPDRIAMIYLRDPRGATPGLDARLRTAFDGLPPSLWRVFADGGEVHDALPGR